MKKILIGLALSVLAISPAMANEFSGIRVEATAGADDVTGIKDTNDVTYGVTAGIDFPVTSKAIVGVEANVDNVFENRDFGASVRAGYAVLPSVLVYGKAGYANYRDITSRNLEGLRVGGGVEVNIGGNSYVGAEYRYSDFEKNVGKHGGFLKAGLRF